MALSCQVQAQQSQPAISLHIGDTAPALAVGRWIQGKPVAALEAGTIYVVEFWSTQCGCCWASMPELSRLQRKYADVTVIGQDIWDDDEKVSGFVNRMGERLTYRVVLDDKSSTQSGAMAAGWMKAAGRRGIPTSFVVGKDGKIAWIGHPTELPVVLEKVVRGTYDAAAAEAQQAKADVLFRRARDCREHNDIDGVKRLLAEVLSIDPEAAADVDITAFQLLLETDRSARALEAGTRVIARANTETQSITLHGLALDVTRMKSPTVEALVWARQALRRARQLRNYSIGTIFDTEAQICAMEGDWQQARHAEEKALAAAETDDERAEYASRLKTLMEGAVPRSSARFGG